MPNQWVAIRPEQTDSTAPSVSMQLPHPRTGENARYVVQADGAMLEIQKIEADHKQSWFIGNSVQKDGVLYMMTTVDPLFVLLPILDQIRQKTDESEGRFVQIDDVLNGQDNDKYKALHHLSRIPDLAEQMQHLCDKQEFAPGMYSYRLNQDKTLQWLRLKADSISSNIQHIPVLLQFAKEQLFDIDAPETNDHIRNDAYTWTGIQVVTEYLPTTWETRLVQSYDLGDLEKQVEQHKKQVEKQMQNYCTTNPAEYAKVKREGSDESDQSTKKSKLSAGQRTLAKANIKGMKSLTSFFGKNSMRIRTITAFVALPAAKLNEARQVWEPLLQKGLDVIAQAKLLLETAGYEVQTTRIATNPFPEFTTNDTVKEACILLDQICSDRGIMMLNVGPASDLQTIQLIPDLISSTKHLSASSSIPIQDNGIINRRFAVEGAKVMQKIGQASHDLNFRFCVAANTKPGIPFFPVGYGPSYNKDTPSVTFALGLECSDLVVDAFARAKAHIDMDQDPSEANAILWEKAADELKNTFEDACIPLEKLMQSNDTCAFYTGIDVSVAPSCGADSIKASLTTAYESIIPKFGGAGTLSISALITGVLKKLNVLKCGYSGLMLPIMEDPGLAARFADGSYSVQEVLLYSTVCGCGLDCVPIAGDTSLDALANLLADTATLAHRLNKPLSARIFPLLGLTENMHTQFENPLLVNTRVAKLE